MGYVEAFASNLQILKACKPVSVLHLSPQSIRETPAGLLTAQVVLSAAACVPLRPPQEKTAISPPATRSPRWPVSRAAKDQLFERPSVRRSSDATMRPIQPRVRCLRTIINQVSAKEPEVCCLDVSASRVSRVARKPHKLGGHRRCSKPSGRKVVGQGRKGLVAAWLYCISIPCAPARPE